MEGYKGGGGFYFGGGEGEEDQKSEKKDNVVFVWRDWCVLGLWGPQSDCGSRDSLSDSGTCLFIFIRQIMLQIKIVVLPPSFHSSDFYPKS